MAKTIDQHAEDLVQMMYKGDSHKALHAKAKSALLTVAREQREACQAALGTVRQVVVGGSGYVKTSEVATAIRNAEIGTQETK